MPVHLRDVVDAVDAGVEHLAGGADLVELALKPALVTLQGFPQELQRHGLAELQVVGAVWL